MIDRSQVQVTIEWAKVTHQNRVKRINKPSQDLPTFIGQVRAHFKELHDVEYLYDATGKKLPGEKSKFVLRWHSQSPVDASILDQSINAVELTDQEQFLEIFCTHAIVDHNNRRQSTPRFVVYIIEPAAQALGAGLEAASGEQMALSMSPIAKQQSESDQKPVVVYDGNLEEESKDGVDLSQAVKPLDLLKEGSPEEEESKDPKMKASEIINSVFGEGAEDAVSYDGNVSASDPISEGNEEELGESIVEEAYIVAEHSQDLPEESKKPIKLIEEPVKQPSQEQEKELVAKRDTLVPPLDLDQEINQKEAQISEPVQEESGQEDALEKVLAEESDVQMPEEEFKEAPNSQRMPSIGLPSKSSSIMEESKDVVPPLSQENTAKKFNEQDQNEKSKIAAALAEKTKQMLESAGEGSSDSDDSDFDMVEALEKSAELQAYLREEIRKELNVIGPQIFDKLKGEFGLKAAGESAAEFRADQELAIELRESWHMQKEDAAASQEQENVLIESASKEEIKQAIDSQISISMISDGMEGGWKMEHIHKSQEEMPPQELDAPDKSLEANPQLESSADPVIVNNEADQEESKARPNEQAKQQSLQDIHIKATMKQEKVVPAKAAQPPMGLFKSFVSDIKQIMTTRNQKPQRNRIGLANGAEFAEVYTEVTRTESRKVHAHVHWKLRNKSDKFSWTEDMQLTPVFSCPTLRIHFESDICGLAPDSSGEMNLRFRIPEDFQGNHLILLLKLKQGDFFRGPNLLLFVKIIKRRSSQDGEISSFEVENLSDDKNGGTVERQLALIAQGKDVYTEQQLLHMGSILSDEGYGTFDRCMMTLRTLRGDIEKAREILSKITFTEAQIS